MPPITKEVLVGTLLIGYVRLLELKLLSLFVSVPELALTPESRSNFLPGTIPQSGSATDTYASNLGMSIHAQLTKPAHTALCS